MKHDRATGDVQETAALYALGSLGQHEARAFETHLKDGCPACEAELRQFEAIVGEIGLSAPEAEPPEYLRELLAARIERESGAAETAAGAPIQQAEAHATQAEVPAAAPQKKPETAPPRAPTSAPHPIFASPPKEQSRFPWLLSIGLAIAAALAFIAWRQSEGIISRLNEKLGTAQADATNLRTLMEVQRERNRQLDDIYYAFKSGAMKLIYLKGQANLPSSSLAALWDTQKSSWLLLGYLPLPPEGKVYQLWFFTMGGIVDGGVVRTDPLGNVFIRMKLPANAASLSAAGITLEPEGGSRQPTSPPVALGRAS